MIRIWPITSGACPHLLLLPDLKITAQFVCSSIYHVTITQLIQPYLDERLKTSNLHIGCPRTISVHLVGVQFRSCLLQDTRSVYFHFVARNASLTVTSNIPMQHSEAWMLFFRNTNHRMTSTLSFLSNPRIFLETGSFQVPDGVLGENFYGHPMREWSMVRCSIVVDSLVISIFGTSYNFLKWKWRWWAVYFRVTLMSCFTDC